MKKLLLMAIIGLTFTSCGFHGGFMSSSASLGKANFSYTERDVEGTSKTTHVLGIGGLGKKALVNEAKKNLHFKHPLGPNQTYANITVNWKTSFFLVASTNRCTVTADIVEFDHNEATDLVTKN